VPTARRPIPRRLRSGDDPGPQPQLHHRLATWLVGWPILDRSRKRKPHWPIFVLRFHGFVAVWQRHRARKSLWNLGGSVSS
jgi:hypothetical protein